MIKLRKKCGVTLVELLLSVAILAVLLTSIATAMYASIHSYRENHSIAAVAQTARSVLDRIIRDVRTAAAVDSTSTSIAVIPPDDGSGLELITYQFTSGSLNYSRTVNSSTASYVLIGSSDEVTLSSFNVTAQSGSDWLGQPCVKSLTVTLVLTSGNETLRMIASADPRRNQLY